MDSAVRHETVLTTNTGWPTRVGLPTRLVWGFVAVLIFMTGEGVQTGYIATYLAEQPGFSRGMAETAVAAYGAAAAVGAWLSGVLTSLHGPRNTMRAGALLWCLFELLFLLLHGQLGDLGLTTVYALRGLGYPLFAYGFLVWVNLATPSARLAPALGWYWFAFAAGLPTIGSLIASFAIPAIGSYRTLWVSLGLVVLGGGVGSFAVRDRTGSAALASGSRRYWSGLTRGATICWRRPRVLLGMLVKIANSAPMFGFFVLLPFFFEQQLSMSTSRWLLLNSLIFVANLFGNLLSGFLANRIGWRSTVTYAGAMGCAAATLLLYYVPIAAGGRHAFALAVCCGVLYGFTLAGFVPLSALMPALAAPGEAGEALAVLNLGSGLASFLGPALVAAFRPALGVGGIIWLFTALYALAAVASRFLTASSDPGNRRIPRPRRPTEGRVVPRSDTTRVG